MPLRLFRSRNVTGANVVMGLLVVGFFGMFFLGALYLQGILGYTPLEVGLAFLPSCLVMGTLSLGYAEKLIMGIGARNALVGGLVSATTGLLLFTRAPVDGSYVEHLLPVMLLLGGGAGLAFPALMTLAMSGATPSDSGLASGFVNTTVQVGGAIGLAVLATLATERTDGLRADGVARDAALNSGFHLAYLIGAVLTAVAIVVALVVLRSEPAAAEAAEQAEDEQAYYAEAA
jgi:predicted MFS family arabinose efflux permease